METRTVNKIDRLKELPYLNYVANDQLQLLVLQQVLVQEGIENPVAFLEENDVDYRVAYWPEVGMGITITRITTKPPVPTKPLVVQQ
jgi:hypothetical protein